MIEVERKFQPTEEQMAALLEDAEFLGEKNIRDLYYDFPDFRIYKSGNRLRKRDSGYEMKIYQPDTVSTIEIAREIENDQEIKDFLGFTKDTRSLNEIVLNDMQYVCDFTTKRKKYKKEDFNIDIDETSFGYNAVEIEVMVDDKDKAKEAEDKILKLANTYGLEIKKLPLKSRAYLEKERPEIYEILKDYL